jgi:hypothetical protein
LQEPLAQGAWTSTLHRQISINHISLKHIYHHQERFLPFIYSSLLSSPLLSLDKGGERRTINFHFLLLECVGACAAIVKCHSCLHRAPWITDTASPRLTRLTTASTTLSCLSPPRHPAAGSPPLPRHQAPPPIHHHPPRCEGSSSHPYLLLPPQPSTTIIAQHIP